MNFQALLDHYGYAAVFIGTFIEGETMLTLGAYAAHRGFLHLSVVMAAAWLAAMIHDQLWFQLGRRHGADFLGTHGQLRGKVEPLLLRVQRHGLWLVLATRFLWGMRMALPLAVGMSGMGTARFMLLDGVSAAAWAVLVGSLGYAASELLATVAADIHRHEHLIFGVLLVVALAVVVWRTWRSMSNRQ